MSFIDLGNDGFTWESVSQKVVFSPLVWGILTLPVAALGVWSLRRRAGAAGIALSASALDDRQTHVLRPVLVSDGWQDRVREELATSERAFLVAEKGDEEIHFRWRPGRGSSPCGDRCPSTHPRGTSSSTSGTRRDSWGCPGWARGSRSSRCVK